MDIGEIKIIYCWNNVRNNFVGGFTLLELLVALVIIAVLAIAIYPSYAHHFARTHRVNITSVLRDIAGRMEQFYIKNHSYEDATLDKLGVGGSDRYADYQKHYQLKISSAVDSYVLSATPIGAQVKTDALCGMLSLDHLGNKKVSGTGSLATCWP